MVTIQCGVGGLEQANNNIHQEFIQYILLFQQIGNSIVIYDKWIKSNASNQPAMEYLYGSLWWVNIVISFVLTWGIGLFSPLVVRYLIIKKPLSKPWAISLVVIFWVMNIIIFTALGSESKTHAALFLVAWVSYIILKKKNKILRNSANFGIRYDP